MTQSLSLTPSTLPIGLNPVWRAATCTFEGATVSGVTLYRAQMWRRPQDVRDATIEPLATSYATVASGRASFSFTDAQMDFALEADHGAKDDVWISFAGLRSGGQVQMLRADWLTVVEPGCSTDDFVDSAASFTVASDWLVITFAGTDFRAPVEEVALPSGATNGTYSVTSDRATFISDGAAYSAPVEAVTTPSGLANGGLLVLEDWAYIMDSGQAYRLPVEAV